MAVLRPGLYESERLRFGYFALLVGIGDNAAHLSISMIVFRFGKTVPIISFHKKAAWLDLVPSSVR